MMQPVVAMVPVRGRALGFALAVSIVALTCAACPTNAQVALCEAGLPEAPALPLHMEQDDIVSGRHDLETVLAHGKAVFEAPFNACDGQGRPTSTGTGARRARGQPAFIRTSGPDATSCAGCHNMPRAGGAGDIVANAFVLAQALDPVTTSVAALHSNERNTPGMFGSGAIELLAREMTDELLAGQRGLPDGDHVLRAKGVAFPITLAGGEVVAAEGVDTDLIVKPFHQSGVVRSLREFTVNALNHHHGMQAEERFDLNPSAGFDADHDTDGIRRELTIGDVTTVTLHQAALAVPGRVLPSDPEALGRVRQGEALFADIGCATCHVPHMLLHSAQFVEPYSRNLPGTFADAGRAITLDLTRDGEAPRLERALGGGAIVRAYTDLKRHNLCDPEHMPGAIRTLCNERLAQGRPDLNGRPGSEFFLTRKLWDVGNSGPYGHRGDLITLSEAILAHGGEARSSRDRFVAVGTDGQIAIIAFLKSLQVLPTPPD